jgi:CubicO group peptidase (beta-lactamase class C family)
MYMLRRNLMRRIMAFLFCATTIAAPVFSPIKGQSQNNATASAQSSDLSAQLAAIEKAIEEKRKETGAPGVAVVVVKDDKVILQKGFGLRDIERNLPVTPKTLFPIASCTKAFTAMAAVISADEGKLSLDDSPKKYLPYFRLQDPEADSKITVRDLLIHNSGLDQTDISWYTGALTREEVIRVAGLAKPTAKFREKFQYQNVMYVAAGEVVAESNKSTWEKIIADRFFGPLGMKSSKTSVKEMQKAADFASGYQLEEKAAIKRPIRDTTNIAPAGAIYSNIEDMAQWVRLMLGKGVFEGQRFVSEKGFEEITKRQIAWGAAYYGLGWTLSRWRGQQILSHGGLTADGFNSLVALMPEQKVGLVFLTNYYGSSLSYAIQEAVFSNLVGKPGAAEAKVAETPVGSKNEVGKYTSGGITIEVVFKGGKLYGIAPGRPEVPLTNIGERKYKIGPPTQDGFLVTFRPIKGREKEMSKVGEEEVYVVIKTPEKGTAITDYISAKTFLLVKRDMFSTPVACIQGFVPISETFSDFRSIGGIMIPFQSVSNHPELGRVVARVKEVKFDESIPDATFRSQKQTQLH